MSSILRGFFTFFHHLTFIVIVLSTFTTFTSAGIGSSSLSRIDNTNPANADPRLSITCVGEYDKALPVEAGFSPIYPLGIPMQKLCAKTQFNGGPPGQHVGGWCQSGRYHSGVVFDLSVAAQINPMVANPRVMLACSYRCFCNYGLAPNAPQPRYGDYAQSWESDQTYELQLDVVDDYDVAWTSNFGLLSEDSDVEVPQLSHKGTAGKNPVTVAEIQTESQQVYSLDPSGAQPRVSYVSMDAENNIDCHGFLPKFPLPSPYRTSDFSTLEELCAVQFSGGKRLVLFYFPFVTTLC